MRASATSRDKLRMRATVTGAEHGQVMAEYGVILMVVTAALIGFFNIVLPGAISDGLGAVVAQL